MNPPIKFGVMRHFDVAEESVNFAQEMTQKGFFCTTPKLTWLVEVYELVKCDHCQCHVREGNFCHECGKLLPLARCEQIANSASKTQVG